ncbi:MAG: hypothetical protein IPF52_11550 [Saprospiraceae bacterium]|nr:hypothetical protein [Saprospiraceae bacterium]
MDIPARASPIYATLVGLLKYSIDNKDNVANAYVEESKSINSARRTKKKNRPRYSTTTMMNRKTILMKEEEAKRQGIFNKLFTFYRKDFLKRYLIPSFNSFFEV